MAHAKVDWNWDGNEEGTIWNRKVVHAPGVSLKKENYLMALKGQSIAAALLAPHKARSDIYKPDDHPGSSITISEGSLDAFVNLEDPDGGAGAIEAKLDILDRAKWLM